MHHDSDRIDLERLLPATLALRDDVLPSLTALAQARAGGDSRAVHRRYAAVSQSVTSSKLRREGPIAIIPIVGPIFHSGFLAWLLDGVTPDAIAASLREATNDPEIVGILLLTNSPGGGVDLIQEVAADIRAARTRKPVVSVVRTMCASAAFWLAAQADEIISTPSGEIGSVGVFTIHYDQSKLNERIGITPTYIFAGRHKVEGNSDMPLADDTRAFVQKQVDHVRDLFVADLARGRRVTEATVRRDYGEGRLFHATDALSRGMVDRVETLDATVSRLAKTGKARMVALRDEQRQRQAELDLMDVDLRLMELGLR